MFDSNSFDTQSFDESSFDFGTDTTPDVFTFDDQAGVPQSSVRTSNVITATGISEAVAITIIGGTFSKNGGAYGSADDTVVSGDTVTVRHTSSASYLTATNTVMTIGGVSDTFTSITEGDPANTANLFRPFSFNWWNE